MAHDAAIRHLDPLIRTTLVATLLLMAGGAMQGEALQGESAGAGPSAALLIQGRIVAMQGALVTVKTPDDYPGTGPGVHPQVVLAGPTYRIDVSGARVLLPDGRRRDNAPLAVGDHVVMLLNDVDSAQPPGPGINRTYHASIVERIAAGDKITTH